MRFYLLHILWGSCQFIQNDSRHHHIIYDTSNNNNNAYDTSNNNNNEHFVEVTKDVNNKIKM